VNREHSTTLKRQTWEQKPTYGINLLCTADDCFQNCQLGCGGTFSFDPEEILMKSSAFGWGSDHYCRVCYHYYTDHQHFRAKWATKSNVQSVVDYDARSRFRAAQSHVSTNSLHQRSAQQNLQQCKQELKKLQGELCDLCNEFRRLSLAGSFTDHLASTARLLEVRLSTIRSGGADATASKQMEAKVEAANKKLAIVKAAERM
jgi:hypothetical protein